MRSPQTLSRFSIVCFAAFATYKAAMAEPTPSHNCSGDLRCMASEAATGDCGGANPEAITSLAALGLISDALNAANAMSCSHDHDDAWRSMKMRRARSLGRIAVAQKLSGLGDGRADIEAAIQLAREARAPTAHPYGFGNAYDEMFADAICDIASDLIVIGNIQSGQELTEQAQDVPPYFMAGCLGRLGGVLDRLGKADDANEFRREALGHVATIRNRSEQQIALGRIALGSFDAGHVTVALQELRGSGLAEFQSDMFAGGIRLGFYRSMAMQEAVIGHFDEAWTIGEAARNDTGFPPWVDLAELLRATAATGVPSESRRLTDRAQVLVTEIPAASMDPTFRAALGSTLINAGEQEKGRAQLTAVAQAVQAATTANIRDYYQTSLIRAYAEIGDVGQALDLLNQSFPETNTLPGKINRWGALRDIALAANRRGEAARAVQIAEQAHDQELRNLVIRAVAMRAVNGGKFAEAEQWARMIDSDRDIQAVLAEISARGALALSGSNQWIVVRRDEEKLRTYPGAFSSAFDP